MTTCILGIAWVRLGGQFRRLSCGGLGMSNQLGIQLCQRDIERSLGHAKKFGLLVIQVFMYSETLITSSSYHTTHVQVLWTKDLRICWSTGEQGAAFQSNCTNIHQNLGQWVSAYLPPTNAFLLVRIIIERLPLLPVTRHTPRCVRWTRSPRTPELTIAHQI